MKQMILSIVLGVFGVLAVVFLLFCLGSFFFSRKQFDKPVYGVTFSTFYAKQLGLDWKQVFEATLTDLNQKDFRIPLYWSAVETNRGVYDFSDIDWMMDRASESGARVTLAVGIKVPRWPECFIPEWAEGLSKEEYDQAVFEYLEVVARRYKDHPALQRWQIENEPFFPFGDCPTPDARRFYKEIELVRGIDEHHDIQRTVSGEQSIWAMSTQGVDVVGASLYRTVYTPIIGYTTFPIPPFFYAMQAKFVRFLGARPIISELQLEPWFPPNGDELLLDEKYQLFTEKRFQKNVEFARATGLSEVYTWGVEWWYFLKKNGYPQLWDAARELGVSE